MLNLVEKFTPAVEADERRGPRRPVEYVARRRRRRRRCGRSPSTGPPAARWDKIKTITTGIV